MRASASRYHLPAIIAVTCLWILQGGAYADTITLNGRTDAGLYPGQVAQVRFSDATDGHLLNVVDASLPAWTSSQQVYDYASAQGLTNWLLESSGDIWSSDPDVGESLTNLRAATYRITPLAGAYMYDSWGWNPEYEGKFWWELHILANQVIQNGTVVPEAYYMLGSYSSYPSADSAFTASQSLVQNITLDEGGSLQFWIWDWNSLDNSGSLTFQVTPIPEPSTLLLCAAGMLIVFARARK